MAKIDFAQYESIQRKITKSKVNKYSDSGLCASILGREFGSWISNRNNDLYEFSTIHHPAYIIESLMRDEVFTERGLKVSGTVTSKQFNISNLTVDIDDFYNGATIYNANTNMSATITDYRASDKLVTVDSTINTNSGDNIVISNILGNLPDGSTLRSIDTASFDSVYNNHKDLKLSVYVPDETSVYELIGMICEQAGLLLLRNNVGTYYLKDMTNLGGPIFTFDTALSFNGVKSVEMELTDLNTIYSDLVLKTKFSHLRGEYLDTSMYNKNSPSVGSDYNRVVKDYRQQSTLEYEANFIADDNTKNNFINLITKVITNRRVIVSLVTEFTGHYHINTGDVVLVNFPNELPDSVNLTKKFLVMGKSISIDFVPYISWTLLEIVA